MARMWYAGSPADFTVTEDESNDDALILAPDAELDVYDARTGGSAVTDLLDRTGSPVSSVTTSATGRVLPFQGPDGTSDVLWLDDGVEDRYAVVPHGPFLPLTGGELSGTLSAAAPTAAQHVPRLARTPDPATGDLGLPGYAGSDTGWRDVSADLISGWTGLLELRRTGTTIRLRAVGLTGGSSSAFYHLPAVTGWRVDSSRYAALPTADTSNPRVGRITSTYSCNVIGAAPPSLSIAWDVQASPTDWPTSLPGTQITPPASWS